MSFLEDCRSGANTEAQLIEVYSSSMITRSCTGPVWNMNGPSTSEIYWVFFSTKRTMNWHCTVWWIRIDVVEHEEPWGLRGEGCLVRVPRRWIRPSPCPCPPWIGPGKRDDHADRRTCTRTPEFMWFTPRFFSFFFWYDMPRTMHLWAWICGEKYC